MSFFKKLFGQRDIEGDSVLFAEQLKPMLAEAERVYRNYIQICADEAGATIQIAARGLFKARLQAAAFLLQVFIMRYPGRNDSWAKLVANAIEEAIPHRDGALLDWRDWTESDARALAPGYVKRVLADCTIEFQSGPSLPNRETDGFRDLAALYHEALRDSISFREYQFGNSMQDVADRFDLLVKSGLMSWLVWVLRN